MLPALQALKDLHELDQALLDLRTSMEGKRAALAAGQAELAGAAQTLEASRAHAKEAKAQESLKEVELKGLEGQIDSWTVKLNTTRDNKEYQAILHQIATFKEQKGTLEEEIIGMLDQGGSESTQVRDEDARVGALRQACDALQKETEATLQVLQKEADASEKKREALAAAVPPDAMSRYDRIRNHRGGVGLAAVADGACGGCHMGLTPNQLNLLQQDRDMVACQSCGRILYPA